MKGVTRILNEAQIESIHRAALRLLQEGGMKVCHPQLRDALEKHGARVDSTRERVFLTAEIVHRLVPPKASDMTEWELQPPGPDDLGVWGSHPFVLDWPGGGLRKSTRQDLREALQAAHALPEIKTVGPPLSIGEVPSPVEPAESLALTLLTTDKKVAAAEIILPEQIKYAVALSEIHTGVANSGALVPRSEYFTSPLIFGDRSAECLLEKAQFGIPSWIGTMATSGLNAPATVAGTVTLGLAEILGGLTMARALRPDWTWGAIACTGILDMTTANASFSAPECTLQNMALYQILRRLYGLEICVAQQYVDAPLPGIAATLEKTYRFCTTAGFGAHILLNNGLIKAGLAFSGTQCILDLDTNRALLRVYRGMEVDDDTLAGDVLRAACENEDFNFLNEDHTVRHCRSNFWFPTLPLRTIGQDPTDWQTNDRRLLDQAQERWIQAVRGYEPISVPAEKRRAIEQVVERARRELLS